MIGASITSIGTPLPQSSFVLVVPNRIINQRLIEIEHNRIEKRIIDASSTTREAIRPIHQ